MTLHLSKDESLPNGQAKVRVETVPGWNRDNLNVKLVKDLDRFLRNENLIRVS